MQHEDDSVISEIAFSAIRISTPLIFAALGGLLTYQAGILNIGLDGFMIVGAFASIAIAYVSGSLTLGILAGVASPSVLAGLLPLLHHRFPVRNFDLWIARTVIGYGL